MVRAGSGGKLALVAVAALSLAFVAEVGAFFVGQLLTSGRYFRASDR